MLVTSGSGSYHRPGPPGETVPLTTGSLVLIRPGESHWYGPEPGAVWDEVFCTFSGPVFDLAVRRGALGGHDRVVTVAEPTQVQSVVDRIRIAPPPTTTSAQDAEALDLLSHLVAAAGGPASEEGASGWLARSMQLLASEDGADLTEVAATLGIPYETWRRRFRAQVGIPPARYRLDARLRTAAGLLTMTSLSVTQVAHRTGFVDGRHLSRQFARRYGVTPGRYRRAPVAPPAGRP